MSAEHISSPIEISLDHFRSGRYPSVVEIRGIESFCEEAQKEVDDYNVEISRLRDTIKMMERKSLDLQQSVQRCRAYASPLRKLPAEIWVEIFSECISDGSLAMLDLCDNKDHIWSYTLPLSQTCLFWRAITLSTSRLWSKLELDLSSDRRGLEDLVQLYLQRSEPSPLVLDIHLSRGKPSTRGWSIFWDLMNARSRWLCVKTDILREPLEREDSPQEDAWNQFQFGILKELEVAEDFGFEFNGDFGEPPYRELLPIILKNSPSLSSLKTHGFFKAFVHSYANLNEILLKLTSMRDLVDCFTLCPRLRKASFSSFYLPYENRPLSPLPTKIVHRYLSWLEFEFIEPDEATAILSSLVLSSLVTLNVKFDLESFFQRNDYDESNWFRLTSEFLVTESLKMMITQSSCPLEELELGKGFFMDDAGASDRALVEFLASTPGLRRLNIDAQRYSSFSNEFFQSLTFSASSAKALLPLLEVLHVLIVDVPHLCSEGPLPDPDLIFAMVNSRRAEGCTVQLKMFRFSIQIDPVTPRADEWVQSFTTITEPLLRGLEADGLGLTLRVVSKECRAADWL